MKRRKKLPPVLETALRRQAADGVQIVEPTRGVAVIETKRVAGTLPARIGSGGGFGGDYEIAGGVQLVGNVAHSLRGEGWDASEDGTGRGRPLMVFHPTQDPVASARQCHSLGCGSKSGQANAALMYALQVAHRSSNGWGVNSDVFYTLDCSGPSAVAAQLPKSFLWVVRYLTPRECERLQGIPDDYTLIPWRKSLAADSPRYKAIGNGMAVPCVVWLLTRIDKAKRKR